jgi:AcrR family transcriptional regulator
VVASSAQSGRARHTETNRRAKRDQIIEAAKGILAREGVAACTARAVADAGPLTKSAIHYYFDDIHEIVDRAVLSHLDAMLDKLRTIAELPSSPYGRLENVVDAYLATFVDQPRAAFLWFEYWVDASRRGSLEAVGQMLNSVRTLLRDLLADLPARDPDEAAHTLLSWLLGTIVQQHIRPTKTAVLHNELAAIVEGLSSVDSDGAR